MVLDFPSNIHRWWSPAFLEMTEHLPAPGKWGRNSLFCFMCVAFALLVKLHLTQPMSFPIFTLLIPYPIPLGRGAWSSSCVGHSCWLGLNHRADPSEFLFYTGHRWAAAFAGKKTTGCQKYCPENADYNHNYMTQLNGAKNPPSPFTTPYPSPFILFLSLRASTASSPGFPC